MLLKHAENHKMLNIQHVMLNNSTVKSIHILEIREYIINHEEDNMTKTKKIPLIKLLY